MAGLVEKFDKFKTKIKDRKQLRKKDKYAKNVSKLKHYSDGHVTSAPATEEYRDNYEKIFGHT